MNYNHLRTERLELAVLKTSWCNASHYPTASLYSEIPRSERLLVIIPARRILPKNAAGLDL